MRALSTGFGNNRDEIRTRSLSNSRHFGQASPADFGRSRNSLLSREIQGAAPWSRSARVDESVMNTGAWQRNWLLKFRTEQGISDRITGSWMKFSGSRIAAGSGFKNLPSASGHNLAQAASNPSSSRWCFQLSGRSARISRSRLTAIGCRPSTIACWMSGARKARRQSRRM